jgi:hypothetical protein
MPSDDKPRLGRCLTRPHPRHTIDGGNTVSTITSETERSAVGGMLARSQRGKRDGIFWLVLDWRSINHYSHPATVGVGPRSRRFEPTAEDVTSGFAETLAIWT